MRNAPLLKIEQRRLRILDILARDGKIQVIPLSKELQVTPVTIRSDLDALERNGYLSRTQGGAVQSVKNYYNLDQQLRKHKYAAEKKAIAAAAADLVEDGETLMINSGTTTYYFAAELKRRTNLNIVTNSIAVATELADRPSFRVILLGGEINAQFAFTHGTDAINQLSKYKADKTFLSLDGIHIHSGYTTYNSEEAIIDQHMMERARNTIIVADYAKYGYESFYHVADLASADTIVTNEQIGYDAQQNLHTSGVKVIIAASDND